MDVTSRDLAPQAAVRRADVRDMAIVHQVYRREFVLAPKIIRDLREHETERRAAAQEWFGVMVISMHHHHIAEDDLMYPLMKGSAPQALLDLMEEQHQAVDTAVKTVEARLADWITDVPDSAEALARSYEELLPVLVRHLDDEEEHIVPLIGDSLSAQQYGLMATSGNDMYEPRLLMMCFGAMIEQCAVPDAEFMLSHLPPEVRASWYDHIREEYRELMALLRGGFRPAEFIYPRTVNAS